MSESQNVDDKKLLWWQRIWRRKQLETKLYDSDLLFFSVMFVGLFSLISREEPGVGSFGIGLSIMLFFVLEGGSHGIRPSIKRTFQLFSLCILVVLTVLHWH